MKPLVSAEIEAFAEAHSVPESGVYRALREETCRVMEYPQMFVGSLEGAFLKIIAQLGQAKCLKWAYLRGTARFASRRPLRKTAG